MAAERAGGQRFGGVDGLRALAVAGVVLDHVYLYASPDDARYDLGPLNVLARTSGTAGVVLFFTLSGFLLYRPFAAAVLDRTSGPSVRDYLRNRVLRIFPGYWLALLGAGLVLRTTYLPPLQAEGHSLASEPTVFAANLVLIQGYSPATLLTGIGPAWSLVVEMAFYLALPCLAAVAAVLARRTALGRRRPWMAALVPAGFLLVLGQMGWRLAASLPNTGSGTWAGSWHAVVARSFFAHAGVFAAGVMLAVLHELVVRGSVRLPVAWRATAWATAPVIALPVLIALAEHRITENRATLALSASCALLLGLVVLPGGGRSPFVTLLSWRPLQWTGIVSYGVFLWNEPVVWFLRREGWTTTGRWGFTLALMTTVVAVGVLSSISWRLVERPALSMKRAPRRKLRGRGGVQRSAPLARRPDVAVGGQPRVTPPTLPAQGGPVADESMPPRSSAG